MTFDDVAGWGGFGRPRAGFVPQVGFSDDSDGGRGGSVLPWSADDANKYSRGKLVLIAGSERFPGAAILAARAAQRMGAGYVEAVAPRSILPLLVSAAPSLVATPRAGWRPAALPANAEGRPCAVCVGPGFDVEDDACLQLVLEVLDAADCPVLVDGGGLAALAQPRAVRFLERRFASGRATVLTPHGGEAARIEAGLGIAASDNPEQRARALALATGAVAVLKGPDTYISDGDECACMDEGTPALAKAGTGDVLAGMAAALLAQGMDALAAAKLAAKLHARAGVAAARLYTDICTTPEDVIDFIAAAVRTADAPESTTIGFA